MPLYEKRRFFPACTHKHRTIKIGKSARQVNRVICCANARSSLKIIKFHELLLWQQESEVVVIFIVPDRVAVVVEGARYNFDASDDDQTFWMSK